MSNIIFSGIAAAALVILFLLTARVFVIWTDYATKMGYSVIVVLAPVIILVWMMFTVAIWSDLSDKEKDPPNPPKIEEVK